MRGYKHLISVLLGALILSQLTVLLLSPTLLGSPVAHAASSETSLPGGECNVNNDASYATLPSANVSVAQASGSITLTFDFSMVPVDDYATWFDKAELYFHYVDTSGNWQDYSQMAAFNHEYSIVSEILSTSPTDQLTDADKHNGWLQYTTTPSVRNSNGTFNTINVHMVYQDNGSQHSGGKFTQNARYQYTFVVRTTDRSLGQNQNSAYKKYWDCRRSDVITFGQGASATMPPCATNFTDANPPDTHDLNTDPYKTTANFKWDTMPTGTNIALRITRTATSSTNGTGPTPADATQDFPWDGNYGVKMSIPKSLFALGYINTLNLSVVNTGTKEEAKGCGSVLVNVDQNGNFTTSLNNSGQGSAGDLTGDPCGNSPGAYLGRVFPYAFCEFVVQARDLGSYMVVSAGSLLAKTAGIPGGDEISSKKDLFSFVQGTALDGRVEDKLQDNNLGAISRAAYARVLNIVNGVVLLLLIGIALANILQVQISVYSFKKMLPGLIIGLILANASYFIVRAGLEVSGYIADGLISQQDIKNTTRTASDYIKTFENFGFINQDSAMKFVDSSNNTDTSLVFQQFILNFFLWAAAILVLILAFLFAIRSLIFFLLVPLSPIAFIGLYFPPLGFAWKRWSALMISWIFMPVVAFFWLWMGFIWFNSVSDHAGTLGYFLAYVFGISMIYLAMKTPFTLAGEAKQYVEKWNATGQALGKRYTPYGAGLRGYNRIKKNMSERDKLLNEGLPIQNRYARKFGGDKFVNKPLLKAELNTKKLKEDMESEELLLKNKAEQEKTKNRMAFLEKWKNANNKFVRDFAEKLDKNTKKFGGVMDKLVASGWMAPTSYAQRDAHIRDNTANANLAKNKANKNLTESYYKEEMGVIRAQREFEAEAEQKSAEKTQGDAKMTAAHKNLTAGIVQADPLIRDLAAHIRTNRALDPNFDPNMDVNKLMNYKMPAAFKAARPDLARKLEAFKQTKNVVKSSARHISSAQKSGMDDGAKKEVSEISFGTGELPDAGKLLDQLNAQRGPDGKYDGVSATDAEDLTERFGAFAKKMAGANSVDKVPDATDAVAELIKAVNAMSPGATKRRYQGQLTAYQTALAGATTSQACKALVAQFKTTDIYKDILGRVTGPAKNFRP